MSSAELIQKSAFLWEIPQAGQMRVPGRIYASETLMNNIQQDESLKQVANVAQLPGIIEFSLAMPDIHWGYGFPIGGVAATDASSGVISPGGVGYDINCGVRLLRTDLSAEYIRPRIKNLVTGIFNNIPSGVGSHGAIRKLSRNEVRQVLQKGALWAVENGYGCSDELKYIEDKGLLVGADPDVISERAYMRGAPQLGTLGSGNHFIEISEIVDIYEPEIARQLDLEIGNIVILIHTGSRGLGYQVCDDFIKVTLRATAKYGIFIPDRQLSCAPLNSPEGKDYLGAMRSAANFAFANRQVISALVERTVERILNISPSDLGMRLIWDIAHNIAKIETHEIEGKKRKVCVHRKGATRAFGPGSPDLPQEYREIGQPVLIPGDMGTESYLCVGTLKAMLETFGSSCHGAGRVMSRHKAKKHSQGRNLFREMENAGVFVVAEGKATMAEEMPYAYKNVTDVVNTMHQAGITKKVARFKPMGVVKG
ncbi:MAG TPA: RNA-splicing ligase RtcB [Candidatus Marinimicrobia bacterium]|nr:RNA-splicing ligase RtcB [Candidatus Neomarinimicrobiota bacterium]